MQWSDADSRLRPLPSEKSVTRVDSFRVVQDTDDNDVFVSDMFQTVTRDTYLYRQADSAMRGVILAEEMGLGKTQDSWARTAQSSPEPVSPGRVLGRHEY